MSLVTRSLHVAGKNRRLTSFLFFLLLSFVFLQTHFFKIKKKLNKKFFSTTSVNDRILRRLSMATAGFFLFFFWKIFSLHFLSFIRTERWQKDKLGKNSVPTFSLFLLSTFIVGSFLLSSLLFQRCRRTIALLRPSPSAHPAGRLWTKKGKKKRKKKRKRNKKPRKKDVWSRDGVKARTETR